MLEYHSSIDSVYNSCRIHMHICGIHMTSKEYQKIYTGFHLVRNLKFAHYYVNFSSNIIFSIKCIIILFFFFQILL